MDTWHEEEAKAECRDLRVRVREQDAEIERLRTELAEAKRWRERALVLQPTLCADRWLMAIDAAREEEK